MGPKGFSSPVCKADATPGGYMYIDMKGPDGTVYPMDGEFYEIIFPQKLVFATAALDANKKRLFEALNTVAFEEENGKPKMTLYAVVSNVRSEGAYHLDGMNEGWNSSLDRLVDLLHK